LHLLAKIGNEFFKKLEPLFTQFVNDIRDKDLGDQREINEVCLLWRRFELCDEAFCVRTSE